MTAAEKDQAVEIVPVALAAADLRNALSACLLSVASDKLLEVLHAVHVSKIGNELLFCSTDRYWMTHVTITLEGTPDGDWTTLIRVDDAKRIVAMLPKTDPVSATLAPNVAALSGTAATHFEPLGGDYPQTRQIIPTITAEVEEFGINPKQLAALAKMPGRMKNKPVRLTFAGPMKPVRATWGKDSIQYLSVMMPVRLAS